MKKNTCPPFGIKSKHLVLLGMALLFSLSHQAQSIHLNFTDGTHASYNLVNVQKITFVADVMNLHLREGSVYTWNVSTIDNYKYHESSLNIEQAVTVNTWQVIVYPNPVNSLLNIQFNLPKEDNINVVLYDFQGNLVMEKILGKISSGEFHETLNLINLPKGTYVCKIMGEHYSFTKKIIKH